MAGTDTTAVASDRGPRLRADARRNRERIVAAAREMFVEHGVDVPLDDVARRAGVGNATLYRHFPERGDLVRQVVLSVLERIAERGEEAVAGEPDAFTALRRFVHGAADEKVAALCPLLSEDVDKNHPELRAVRDRMERVVESIVARAHASGRLRADVGAGDLMMVITQLTRPLPGSSGRALDERFTSRHLDMLLDGLRDLDPTPLTGSAVSIHELQRIAAEDPHGGCRSTG